jgi:transcriptional regulator with XRE-family HTH domain
MVAAITNWDTIAGRMTEARTRRGMTRAMLAAAAGYKSASTVYRYELGKVAEPHTDVVFRFAQALGCNPMWLMYGREEPGWE